MFGIKIVREDAPVRKAPARNSPSANSTAVTISTPPNNTSQILFKRGTQTIYMIYVNANELADYIQQHVDKHGRLIDNPPDLTTSTGFIKAGFDYDHEVNRPKLWVAYHDETDNPIHIDLSDVNKVVAFIRTNANDTPKWSSSKQLS